VTAGDGTWSFNDLGVGYAGKKVLEVLPSGYVQTLGAAGYAITGTSGADQTGLNFANFDKFNISGTKYADLDGDGVIDTGDLGLGGVTIFIDVNKDGDYDAGIDLATVTANDGTWAFNNLGTGYAGLKVYEVVPDGFTQTLGMTGYTITGTSGADQSGLNFANHMMSGANRTPGFWQSTLGQSFYNGNPNDQGDANGDGIPDGNKDFVLEGWSTSDLLLTYGIDTGDADTIPDTFRVWDANGNGSKDAGDIFLKASELLAWVGGGASQGGTFADILKRDVAAAFLNTLNNDAIGGSPGGAYALDTEIKDSYAAAIAFINKWSGSSKKSQSADWTAYGSAAHIELAAYNQNGEAMSGATAFQIRFSGDAIHNAAAQNYLLIQEHAAAAGYIDVNDALVGAWTDPNAGGETVTVLMSDTLSPPADYNTGSGDFFLG
jgi:hypothetical protein